MKPSLRLSQAAIAGLMLVAIGDAHAASYANALLNFSNFSFSKTGGSGSVTFTPQNIGGTSASCSDASGGTPAPSGSGTNNPVRANCDNSGGADNAFTSLGVTGSNYGWGDTQLTPGTVTSSNPASLTGLGGITQAEAYQPLWFSTNGIADTGIGSTSRTFSLTVGAGGASFSISFNAQVNADASVSGITDNTNALATTSFGIAFQKAGGGTALSWNPGSGFLQNTGGLTTVTGSSSVSETSPFSLTALVAADPLNPTPGAYNPGTGAFTLTFTLASGVYSYSQTSNAQASALNSIPEPTTLGLFAWGAALLGVRRRAARAK